MNSSLSSFLSRLFVDRKNEHRRKVLSRYREAVAISSWSRDRVRAHQDQQLVKLLAHAAKNVPFYREQLGRQNISESNVREVLAGLPAMERSAIQSDPQAYLAKGFVAETFDDATGGSTGTPLRFKVDRTTQVAREASLYWANHLAGWRYGDRVAMLWGSDRDVGNAKKDTKLELRWFLDNMRWYNAFDMGPDRMMEFHRAMKRFKPHIIVAYAGSLDIYARFLETIDDGQKAKDEGRKAMDGATSPIAHCPFPCALRPLFGYPLTSLVSSAEVLTPGMRENVEQVFGKTVFNRYGNRECGAIAAEDGQGGLLVNQGDFVVEVASPEPMSVPGPILITYLANHAMPFIRYNTGDLGVWTAGQAGIRLDRIVGREGDTIRTRDGKLIHGEYFTHLMYGAIGVKEFQFIQETMDSYCLLVVCNQDYEPLQEAVWRSKMGEILGDHAVLEIKQVSAIPVLPSGKRKFTLSRLPATDILASGDLHG